MDELKTHIVIDFDGTIFTNSFPEVGELIPHAKTIINRWYENNTIVINTCRAGKYEGMAEDALKKNGIKFHWINCNSPQLIQSFGQDCRKLSAYQGIYIDDNQLGGLPKDNKGQVDWLAIYSITREIHHIL
jgi:hypothetical protein